MKTKITALILGILFALPCALRAEEIVITLTEVICMEVLPGNNPLDGPDHMDPTPTRPTSFRATIDGTTLAVSKQEATIPSALAVVVNASTSSMVLNQQFTNSLSEQIATPGIYVLRISTAGGDLVGQFIVQ